MGFSTEVNSRATWQSVSWKSLSEIMGDDNLKYINAGRQLRILADDFEARWYRRRNPQLFKESFVPCRFRMAVTAVAIVALTYCIFSDGLPGEFHVWS